MGKQKTTIFSEISSNNKDETVIVKPFKTTEYVIVPGQEPSHIAVSFFFLYSFYKFIVSIATLLLTFFQN